MRGYRSSPSLPPSLPSVLNVIFEGTVHSVNEGNGLTVNVLATGATTLERDVVVMVMTEDDTAGIYIYMRCDSVIFVIS